MLFKIILFLPIILIFSCSEIDRNNANKVDFDRTFQGVTEGQDVTIHLTHIDEQITGELKLNKLRLQLDGQLQNNGKFELNLTDSVGGQNGKLIGRIKNGEKLVVKWSEFIRNNEHTLALYLVSSTTPVDFNKVYKMANDWCSQINARDYQSILNSYDDTITFYTELRPKDYCIKLKMKYIEKYPDYRQQLDSSILITEYENGLIKADFNKTTIRNGIERKYPSYLIFKRIGDNLKIVEEGDMLTNTNLHKTLVLGDSKRSESIDHFKVKEIETESPNQVNYGLIFLILTIGVGGIYLYNRRTSKAKIIPKTNEEVVIVEKEIFVEKEVVVEKKVVVEKEIIIEVSSDRNTPESEIKGFEFEKFVVKLFPKKYYELIEWTSDKKIDGYYAKNSENPDLILGTKTKNQSGEYVFEEQQTSYFAVECKYRTTMYNNRIEICTEQQLARYKDYGSTHHRDVFIVLGYGGFASNPESLYVIPINEMHRGYLFPNELHRFYRMASTQTFFYYMKESHYLS